MTRTFFSMSENNYKIYRGKCMRWCVALAEVDPSLELRKGWYHCPYQTKREEHFWLVHKETQEIVDPTKLQFLSAGAGEYEEYKGILICEECKVEVREEKVVWNGRFACCSQICALRLVGLAP